MELAYGVSITSSKCWGQDCCFINKYRVSITSSKVYGSMIVTSIKLMPRAHAHDLSPISVSLVAPCNVSLRDQLAWKRQCVPLTSCLCTIVLYTLIDSADLCEILRICCTSCYIVHCFPTQQFGQRNMWSCEIYCELCNYRSLSWSCMLPEWCARHAKNRNTTRSKPDQITTHNDQSIFVALRALV